MARKKLLEDIKRDPARFYRMPGDVLRDRRFGGEEKLEILHAWQSAGDGPEVDAAVAELQTRSGHAAE